MWLTRQHQNCLSSSRCHRPWGLAGQSWCEGMEGKNRPRFPESLTHTVRGRDKSAGMTPGQATAFSGLGAPVCKIRGFA